MVHWDHIIPASFSRRLYLPASVETFDSFLYMSYITGNYKELR